MEMLPDGRGDYRCKGCGASRQKVLETMQYVQDCWTAGIAVGLPA